MFRLLKWGIILGIVAALVVGGVLEITVHPEAAASLPQQITGLVGGASGAESTRAWLTGVKRKGEQWIIQDDSQKLSIATGYIASDADRLLGLMQDKPADASTVLPQAELLLKSIEQARDVIETAEVGAIAEAREDAHSALVAASQALDRLKELEAEQEALHERFNRTTSALTERIGVLDSPDDKEQEEVNEEDRSPVKEEEAEEGEAASIPLEF